MHFFIHVIMYNDAYIDLLMSIWPPKDFNTAEFATDVFLFTENRQKTTTKRYQNYCFVALYIYIFSSTHSFVSLFV